MTMIPPHTHGTQPEDEVDDYGLRECPDCDGAGEISVEDGLPVCCAYAGDEIEDCPTGDGSGKVRI